MAQKVGARAGLKPDKSAADPALKAVRAALEGPVVDVLRREIPALHALPRGTVYDAVMNDPRLLTECFRLFRERPDLFQAVILDQHQSPVTRDDVMLACGRTLEETVALVVRAAARRHFRRQIDPRARPAPPPPPPLPRVRRWAIALGLAAPPPRPVRAASPSGSDSLFRALRAYLRFDWQIPLLPHYAPMNPALVSTLGERLLDIREAAELRALSAASPAPGERRPPLLLDTARRLMKIGQDRIDPEVLWRVVQQMDLGRLFPHGETERIRRAVAQVAATHDEVIKALLPVLGNDIRRFSVFLMVAFVSLGEPRFKQEFCQEGRGHALRRLGERLAALPVPPPCLETMSQFYQGVLGTAYTGGVEPGGQALLLAHPELVRALDALEPGPLSFAR